MSNGPLRLVIPLIILFLLARAAVRAWRHRALAFAVWRAVRPWHVLGAAGLLALVALIATALLAVPPLHLGLGSLVGFSGNAVFAPLAGLTDPAAPGEAAGGGPDWIVAGFATLFLGFLALLLPWLAFVEEETFRAGLEAADLGEQARTALVFGLVHLVMLVPLAAALAIAVAGFVYGRIYRRAFRAGARGQGLPPPAAILATYRPSNRARRAAAIARLREFETLVSHDNGSHDNGRIGLLGRDRPVAVAPAASPEVLQAAGVFASTVWHTTFNTLVVLLLWTLLVADALLS